MKWTYSVKKKTSAVLLLSLVLGITILTNLLERNRFKELEKSFSSMYEDRLMAESYLFHLYENLKKKQDLLQLVKEGGMSRNILEGLDNFKANREGLIEKYTQTYLTEEETAEFDKLKKHLSQMDQLEDEIRQKGIIADLPTDLIRQHEEIAARAFSSISILSDVQTTEGEVLRDKSKKIVMRSVSLSHFEMTILIIIGLIIQGLILSSKSLLTRGTQNPNLN